MNEINAPQSVLSRPVEQALAQACDSIAPTWPLDRMIAVNPWFGMRDRPMAGVAALLGALSGIRMLMPPGYFKGLWKNGINTEHLVAAALCIDPDMTEQVLVQHLDKSQPDDRWHNVSDLVDRLTGPRTTLSWSQEIVSEISQFCAAYFQERPIDAAANVALEGSLYEHWLERVRHDRGLEVLMGQSGLLRRFRALPQHHEDLIAQALQTLTVKEEHLADYLHALLLDINGWASWAAYCQWQAGLASRPTRQLMSQLVAIRLAWDLVLWQHYSDPANQDIGLVCHWSRQWQDFAGLIKAHETAQHLSWVWQLAAEFAYQDRLHQQLRGEMSSEPAMSAVKLQAVFCIDVRSEPMRAALERQSDSIQTIGFAGFFGLPLQHHQTGTELVQPSVPGLLKAQITVAQQPGDAVDRDAMRINTRVRLADVSTAPASAFGLVETLGIGYAFKLLKESFRMSGSGSLKNINTAGKGWLLQSQGVELSVAEKVALVAKILGAMGLTRRFAPVVLLVGHGSSSRNNPQLAGLNCGACGGQSGLVNAQVLAELLNDLEIRQALMLHGIEIPESTRFFAALHNTTTDEIQVEQRQQLDAQVAGWLSQAGISARRARSASIGLERLDDDQLLESMQRRASDWSELRPEWGLANNASFIVAPREWTRHLDLGGRSFLHDYDWHQDPDSGLLELIMTAPMVVSQWINMQYYASVNDNDRYGSGNKMLHNVVGGRLGLFEGNGGDLRTGLSLQSLHDGSQWMHQPLRLSVYIAAPEDRILEIYKKHEVVRSLIDREWMFLFSWNRQTGSIRRLLRGFWQ